MLSRKYRVLAPHSAFQTSLHFTHHHSNNVIRLKPRCWPADTCRDSFTMSRCHDDHDHHGHDHSEGAAHDHTDDLTPALQNHIYEQVDFAAISTLNESEPRAGEKVVQKTWTERLGPQPELSSDADEQLLMHIPYVKRQMACFWALVLTLRQLHSSDPPPQHPHPYLNHRQRPTNPQTLPEPRRPRFLYSLLAPAHANARACSVK